MKQRLLSFVAIAALSCVAMAQSWTAPVKPKSPAEGLLEYATAPVNGGNFFLMNVGEGQFLTGANVWATEISLSADAIPYMQLTTVETEEGSGIFKLRRTNDASDKFYGDHGREGGYNPPAGRNLLFRAGDDGYVDENDQGGDRFVFNESDNGYYYFQSDVTEGKFENANDEYAGSTGAGKYVCFTLTKTDANIEWVFIPVDNVDIDAYKAQAEAYTPQVAIYEARLALYNTLNEAVTYSVDYADASAVYNKSDATAEELTAANEALRPAVNHAALLAAIAASSEDSPYDVTQYVLTNPSFDNGMTGWTITEGMGQNLQVQSQKYSYNDVTIQGFIEAWRDKANGPLSDGVICQTVKGLPEGRYRIEADVMAVWQGAALSEDPKGIYLFYNNGKFTLHSESLATGDGKPEHFTFDFDYDGAAEMTIGLMAEKTNQNWMGFDNLKLYAIGEVQTPPSFYALMTEVEVSEEYDTDDIYAEASLKTAFQAAYAPAVTLAGDQNPTKEKADNYTNAYETLHEARLALMASIDSYKKLHDFMDRIQSDYYSYYGQAMFVNLCTQLNNMLSEYQGGYENGSYTSGEIDGFIAAYDNVIKDYIQGLFDSAAQDAAENGTTLDEPINITSLFEHMSYAYGTTQTAYTSGYPAPNTETGVEAVWKVEQGGYFKINYSTGEVWDARPFRIARTFENLPNGRYEIRVHGAYRMAANDTNYPAYNNHEYDGQEGAFLFAGNKKTAFTNIAEVAAEGDAENLPFANPYDAGDGFYCINNQQSAHMLFSDAAYADLAAKCYIAAATNVKNGTLTVGVLGNENLQANHWTVWQDFELYYYGAADADALNEEIEALIAIAEPLAEDGGGDEGAILVNDIINDLKGAVSQGYDAIDANAETQKAAIKALEDAIALARENMSVFTELTALLEERTTAINDLSEYTFNDQNGYQALIDEIDAHISAEAFDSHEQMQTYVARLKNEWFDYLFSVQGLSDASETSPMDMTLLMANPSFDDSWNGWTYSTPRGNPGIEASSGNCAEFWNTGTFDIHQELPYLKDGYWRLSVDALYRPGNPGDVTPMLNSEEGIVLTNEFLYVTGTDLEKAEKAIMQWSDITNGALKYTTEPDPADETQTINVFDEKDKAAAEAIGDKRVEYSCDAFKFIAPNNRGHFKAFVGAGRYHNELVFKYEGEAIQNAVTFGIKLLDDITKGSCWCPFDDFKLEYLGTDTPTAVEGLGAKTSASATINAIYSIDGRQQSQLRRGINIVRTADGKINKVLVK